MKVKFLSNTEYQTFPETEDMIDVDEELLKQIGFTKQFINGKIIDYNVPSIEKEIKELKVKLINTDYIVLKIAEAVTDEEKYELRVKYANEISQRKAYRDRINELEKQLNN